MAKIRKLLLLVENASVPLDNRVWAEAVTLLEHGFQVSIIGPKGPSMDQEAYICIRGIHIYRYSLPTISNSSASYFLEYSISLFMTFLLSVKVLFRHGF